MTLLGRRFDATGLGLALGEDQSHSIANAPCDHIAVDHAPFRDDVGLTEIMLSRRRQVLFRLAMMGLMVVFFSRYLSFSLMVLWAAIYTALQAAEFYALPARPLVWTRRKMATRLAILTLNSIVFGLPAVLWAHFGGLLGLVCGAYLLSGSILNTVLMTRGYTAAFLASATPFIVYVAAGAVLAANSQASFSALITVNIAGAMMSLGAIKLWQESSSSYGKERAFRAVLAEREVELAKALEQAEEASRSKSAFLATMSHELRTPLNGVVGMAQALAASGLPPHQADMVRTIERAGRSLSVILNDVLDLSKLNADKLDLHAADFDLTAFLSDIAALFREPAQQKGLGLSLNCSSSCIGVFTGDEHRLHQMLSNLLSNAVKFTERGEIRLDAAVADEGGAARLTMIVSDTGPGIAAAFLPRLFDSFSQGDASTAVTHGGTGLGLAIVRQLCRLMGGDVSVDSTPGAGAAFTVTAMLARSAQTQAEPHGGAALATTSGRILVAEDNEVNRRVLGALLVNAGLGLDFVVNGAQALEAYLARTYDLILMDVSMPVMTGIEATQAIRALETQRALPRIPIIALTANALPAQIDACMRAGMDLHVAKPIDVKTLYTAIEAALGAAPQITAPPQNFVAV